MGRKTKPLRYAVGMFGTSIPINMFKTYAAIYYVDKLGLSTALFSLVLLIYTFIDAADNPIYGYLSDRTRTRWGRRRPWLVVGAPLLGLGLVAFYNPPAALAGRSLFIYYSVVPVWRAALLILGLGFIPLYFVSSLTSAVLASAFVGIGFAGVICTMDLIGARIIDEDSAASGVRREAIYSNAIGFMNRLNGLFTSLAFYLVYTFYGFESGENPGPNPAQAVRFLLVLFPVLLIAISYLFSRFLDFEDSEEVPHVRAVSHH